MKRWYRVDRRGLLIEISAREQPFIGGVGDHWYLTPDEAFRVARSNLAYARESAEQALKEAGSNLAAFDAGAEASRKVFGGRAARAEGGTTT